MVLVKSELEILYSTIIPHVASSVEALKGYQLMKLNQNLV